MKVINWMDKYYKDLVYLIIAILCFYRGVWMSFQTQEACEAFLRVAVVNGVMNCLIVFGFWYTIVQTLTLIGKYLEPNADT